MLDWKILGASFAALLIVSSALIGGAGIGDTFSGIMDRISQWLGGNTVSLDTGEKEEVQITIRPDILILPIDSESIINVDSLTLKDFTGEIILDYENKLITMQSDLEITSPLQEMSIQDAEFRRLVLEFTGVEIKKGDWTETTDVSKVEVVDFSGDLKITEEAIIMTGTVSSIVK